MAHEHVSAAIRRLIVAQQIVHNDERVAEIDSHLRSHELPALKRAIRKARLFVLHEASMMQIMDATEIASENNEPPGDVPTRLPFDAVYVDSGLVGYETDQGDHFLGVVLYLEVGVFRSWMLCTDAKQAPFFLPLYTDKQWRSEGASYVVPYIASILNAQPPVAHALTFAERRDWKKRARGIGTVPMPYYVVETPAFTIGASGVEPSQARAAPTYRFDSRAHSRLLCYRGKQSLSDRDRASLERRGYEIFVSELPANWAEVLLMRGHLAVEPGEWIALRLVDVRASIKGAVDLPYVPSARLNLQPSRDRDP